MFRRHFRRAAIWRYFLCASVITYAHAWAAGDSGSALRISLEGQSPIELSVSDLQDLPQSTVTVTDEGGEQATYTGALIADILQRAGVQMGKALRGKRLAEYLLVEASDGYQVVYALPELDALFRDRKITLAYSRNGKPLPEVEGALRVVHPEEKRFARWIRHVVSFTVRSADANSAR
jgi:DMSO/TMAO reductase YedYZ molybdopterin-dependent catalytic subunit